MPRGTPVSLRLLFTNRLLPALFGQIGEASGKATKEAADKPAVLGRLLSAARVREFRADAGTRSHDGVLTCAEGWRLYGLTAPPAEPPADKGAKGAQGAITSFFGKKAAAAPAPSGAAAAGGGESGGASLAPSPSRSAPASNPPTPGGAAAEAEARRRERAVAALEARRREIGAQSGQADGEPMLLCNLAAELANETRLLASARAKLARLGER